MIKNNTPKKKNAKNSFSDIIPESDQFLYGLHPRVQLNLQGHEQTADIMCNLFNSNKAPHGFLFLGQQGIGKATFVYHLIRALERKGNAITPADIYDTQKDMVYRRIEILSHGNLKIIRRGYNHKTHKLFQNIRMEDIQEFKPFFTLKPHTNGKRYVVIDCLDDCVHGQNSVPNAILKTLEEPPENCYFFILAHKEGMVLPTIKSRCMKITMIPPSHDALSHILEGMPNFKPQNLDKIIPLSNGSVRLAMVLADNLWFSTFNMIKKALFKAIPAREAIPLQGLKDKAFAGTMTHSEYLFAFQLLCTKAISENAKFSVSQGDHQSAFASGVIFDKINMVFTKAEEYNFSAVDVIENVMACLDYYHYVKLQVTPIMKN